MDNRLSEGLFLVNRAALVKGNMRSPAVCTFKFPTFRFGAIFVRICFSTNNTLLVLATVLCLLPKTLALKTLLDQGLITEFLYLVNDACFLTYKAITN